MLLDLCEIALSRQWPPEVFLRLCNQLSDSTDLFEDHSGSLVERAITPPLSPLLMEYVLILSSNFNSIVPAISLLHRWASQDWKSRTDEERSLISYMARGVDRWQLQLPNEELKSVLDILLTQTFEGCVEIRFLLFQMGKCGLVAEIIKSSPSPVLCARIQEVLGQKQNIYALFRIPMQDTGDKVGLEKRSQPMSAASVATSPVDNYRPSRTFRLLWLDWIATASGLGTSNEAMKAMVELLWPGDLPQVVAYELCITAFDVFASCIQEQQQPSSAEAVEELYQQQLADRRDRRHFLASFITRRLPLLLEQLVGTNLDGTLARVFTTMDKTLSQVVDGFGSDIRTEFGRTCVDIGLCDPTVLHVLHKSHTPRIDKGLIGLNYMPIDSISNSLTSPNQRFGADCFAAKLIAQLPDLGPRSLRSVSQRLLKFVQSPLKSIRPISLLCYALMTESEHADLIFVNVPLPHFIHAIFSQSDKFSKLKGATNNKDDSVYIDIGVILSFAETMAQRYHEQLNGYTGWTASILSSKSLVSTVDLGQAENSLLGGWIIGLFGGGGISDELLKSTSELLYILPIILQQSAVAYRSAVIDRETLRSGLENFVKPMFLPLLGPAILQTLKREVIQAVHIDEILEMVHILIRALLNAEGQLVDVAKVSAGNRLREIIRFAHPDSPNGRKILQSLIQLSTDLPRGLYSSLVTNSPFTGSVIEAAKGALKELNVWQSRPTGAPIVNSTVLRLAARIISPTRIRQLVESCCPGHFNEVAIAVLVVISLSCDGVANTLLSSAGNFQTAAVAKTFYDRLKGISDKSAIAQGSDLPETDLKPEPMLVEPMDSIGVQKESGVPELDGNTNSALDDLGYDDMDLDAQSVNLADLDNATNLDWI